MTTFLYFAIGILYVYISAQLAKTKKGFNLKDHSPAVVAIAFIIIIWFWPIAMILDFIHFLKNK